MALVLKVLRAGAQDEQAQVAVLEVVEGDWEVWEQHSAAVG